MKTVFLISMPGPIWGSVLVLTLIVLIYSVSKAVMRYLDKNKK